MTMNTQLLYQTDSYLKQFTAKVLAQQDNTILFDQTAFYPGGGQPADGGFIRWQGRELSLRKIEKKGEAVWHHFEGDLPPLGEEIEGALDWERRYSLMRTHTALHIPDLIRTKINLLPAGIEHVRTVEIVGLDLQADGGTHVANTREVGRIKITGHESKGKINKRLRIAVAD